MGYHKVTEGDIAFLETIAPGRVLSGNAIGVDYCHDELNGVTGKPEVLVRVKSTEEVSSIMAYANDKRIRCCRGSHGPVCAAVQSAAGSCWRQS